MKLGPATDSAIDRIAKALPFLKTDPETAIPADQRDVVRRIRENAAKNAGGPMDVQIAAAREWIKEEIQRGLDADNAPKGAAKNDTPPESGGLTAPGVLPFSPPKNGESEVAPGVFEKVPADDKPAKSADDKGGKKEGE